MNQASSQDWSRAKCRSSATDGTTTCLPIPSASKSGSLDSLNVSVHHARSPASAKCAPRVSLPTPCRAASDRVGHDGPLGCGCGLGR